MSGAAAGTASEGARSERPDRALDPIARTSEILFGLIMVLTFTGTISAANAGDEEIRQLLIGAIGCNFAWGVVDAVMFLMSSLTEHGQGLLQIRRVRDARSPQDAYRVISDAVPPVLASVMTDAEFERMRRGLLDMHDLPQRAGLSRQDWIGAVGVFFLVFLSTFPVVVPFLVMSDVHVAIRASNLIAIVMLFAVGYRLGQYGGRIPWRTGISMVLIGIVLVVFTIALGG